MGLKSIKLPFLDEVIQHRYLAPIYYANHHHQMQEATFSLTELLKWGMNITARQILHQTTSCTLKQ